MSAVGAPATVPTGDKIGAAAKALSDASYPFLKEVQDSKEEQSLLKTNERHDFRPHARASS